MDQAYSWGLHGTKCSKTWITRTFCRGCVTCVFCTCTKCYNYMECPQIHIRWYGDKSSLSASTTHWRNKFLFSRQTDKGQHWWCAISQILAIKNLTIRITVFNHQNNTVLNHQNYCTQPSELLYLTIRITVLNHQNYCTQPSELL